MASEVLRLTNIERAKEGAQPLKYNKTIQDAAMIRAKEISVKFSHERPNGTSYKTILGCVNGENIAMGYGDAESVVEGWMSSSGHKVTMLDNRYQYLGVGFYESDNGNYYWVQDFSTGNPDASGSIVFNANGGLINGKSSYTISGSAGSQVWLYDAPEQFEVTNIPVPIRDGFTFAGWYDTLTPSSNRKPLKMAIYTSNGMMLYAKWIPNN